MEFVSKGKWTNPLMGWTSSDDTSQQYDITFDSQEEAVKFAESQGESVP